MRTQRQYSGNLTLHFVRSIWYNNFNERKFIYERTLIMFDFVHPQLVLTFAFFWLGFLTPFIVAKIFIRDYKPQLKENLYLLLFTLICTAIRIIPPAYFAIMAESHPLRFFFITTPRFLTVLFLFLYLYTIKNRSIKKSIIMAIFSDLFAFLGALLSHFIFQQILGYYPSVGMLVQIPFGIVNPLLGILFSILIVLLFNKITKKLQEIIEANWHMETTLTIGSALTWLTYQVISTARFVAYDELTLWLPFLLIAYITVSLVSFFVYFQWQSAKTALQRKESEQQNLLFYMSEIEQQQASIRKFKHDYQNILISLKGFIDSNDLDGLEEYYYNKIETSTQTFTQHNFTLGRLSQIKIKEIKGFLAAKLVNAQNLGIDVNFEVDGEIDQLFVDSVTLVRMLGIILDNAIEELTSLEEGKLQVACFKRGQTVTFVVENTCRKDMPSLHQLEQIGYSSKGKDRGLGLNNLAEFVNSQPNLTLQTSLAKGVFIQKITIGDE